MNRIFLSQEVRLVREYMLAAAAPVVRPFGTFEFAGCFKLDTFVTTIGIHEASFK